MPLRYRLLRALIVATVACGLLFAAIFSVFYVHYSKVVDDRLAAGPIFASVSQIYAAPREVRIGQHLSAAFIAQDLRRAGYNTNPQLGNFQLLGNSIQIKPGPQSYHSTDGATITTGISPNPDADGTADKAAATPDSGVTVLSITADNGAPLAAYKLEPQLITALSEDKDRTKRRLVEYKDIPPQLVQAVTSIEDRRFFEHGGVDYHSMIGWAWHDLRGDRKWTGGGSTLTMQLSRGIFLSPERRIKRKLIEILITFHLESRFNKQQIFEMYANQINLGHRGSYSINGFGEAAQTFFGKDLRQLDTAQCALLAGMIQSPSRLDPYRHPERAMERRNVVLNAMVETGDITAAEATRYKAEPLGLAPANIDAGEAPYFVDLVHDQLTQRISEQDLGHSSLRIYTSLDPELQSAASDAVEAGMKHVDDLVRRLHRKGDTNITYPQVALVAIDPHTGQVLALVGGRNYGVSQLNHAVAERPTGSVFKPFVYATAYNTSLNGTDLDGNGVFTALTRLDDDTSAFPFDNGRQIYSPGNFEKGEFPGMVPAAQAIAHSLNIATISLAEKVGYENVAALARSAGIVNARGTPSVAIGTYNATPIDIAGAYTVFANHGVHLKPWMLDSVRNANGDVVADFAPDAKQVLDPRTAFLTQSLLEGVITHGTAAGVRAKFSAPAAGKTGTSHDAWFAGYTSNLLCVIWIGNDDYTDISNHLTHSLQGADAAAPIWADFMLRASKLPEYSDMKPFVAPDGVQTVLIDRNTWLPADSTCPQDYPIAFLDGTVPSGTCSHMGPSPQIIQGLISTNPTPSPSVTPALPAPAPQAPSQSAASQAPPAADTPDAAEKKKRNIFQKIFGGGKKPDQPPPATPPQ
jgi:penicillin-binding protein 1B